MTRNGNSRPLCRKKILKDLYIYNQSDVMEAILEVGHGHSTQFWKRTIQEASHSSSMVHFGQVVLENIKI